jgi:uncharacterized protein YkwD
MKKYLLLTLLMSTAIIFLGYFIYLGQKPVRTANKATTEQFKASSVQLNADTIFDLVNQERIKAGVKPLVRDTRLDASAQIKADDMANNNYFAHINPTTQVNGYTLIPTGICSYKSENIIMIASSGDKNVSAIDWWLNSKAHHDAMLSPEYDVTGIAVNGIIGVQHFCNLK